MAATTTSGAVSATPSVDTSNIAKGLFTDLGPLLALFGDEVIKQFLSTSLGFGDDLLLAIAPIGIITILVSAIRVGGFPWKKLLIGRQVEPSSLIFIRCSMTNETEPGTLQTMKKRRNSCRRLQTASEKFGMAIASFARLENRRRLNWLSKKADPRLKDPLRCYVLCRTR